MTNRLLYALATLVTSAAAIPAAGQSPATPPQLATFVVLQADDTLAVERVTRTAQRAESDLTIRAQGLRLQFVMALTADALVSSMDVSVRAASANGDAPPLQAGRALFRGESGIAGVTGSSSIKPRLAAGEGGAYVG